MWFACSRVRPPHPQPLSPKGGEGRKKEFRMVGRGEREGIQVGGARGERREFCLGGKVGMAAPSVELLLLGQ
jgi:hypothetical protein